MSASRRGRTEVFNRGQARQRLDYARACHEAAVLIGSDREDAYAVKVAVSLYVLAGISAADAICATAIGERWRGEDHRGAIRFLVNAIPDPRPGRQLGTLLDLKDAAHYSTGMVNADAEKRAERASAALIEKLVLCSAEPMPDSPRAGASSAECRATTGRRVSVVMRED